MTWKNGEYEPKQKRADEKKRLILDAALELIGEKGYHGTNAKEIARRAGVATGSFYRYFRDKKSVLKAVCARMEQRMMQAVFGLGEQMREEGADERRVLEMVAAFAIEGHREHRRFHQEVTALELTDPDVAEIGRRREAAVVSRLTAFLEPMRGAMRVDDFEAAVTLAYHVLEAAAHQAVIIGSPLGEERMVAACTDLLKRYLLADAGGDDR